jgi:hypothetical protein
VVPEGIGLEEVETAGDVVKKSEVVPEEIRCRGRRSLISPRRDHNQGDYRPDCKGVSKTTPS